MANRQSTESAAPASTPEPTATPETVAPIVPAPTVQRIVRFAASKLTQDDMKAKHAGGKNATIANASVVGLLTAPFQHIAVTDFGVTLSPSRDVVVYMPSAGGGFYKHLAPRTVQPTALPDAVMAAYRASGIEPPASDAAPTPDPIGKRQCDALGNAIRESWLAANRACTADGSSPFDRDWPLNV